MAAEAKAKAESAAAEAAKYAEEASDLATRQAAGEDIKSSDIRRAKRKAEKAEQRARAQMKLAQVKADMATRLAGKYDAAIAQDGSNDDFAGPMGEGEGIFGKSYDLDGDGIHDFTELAVDSHGWTVFTPTADSRIVYVSSSTGHDWESGTYYDINSPELANGDAFNPVGSVKAYKTLAAAYKQLRDGHADWMLLKRGDEWEEGPLKLDKSGESKQDRMLISAYGEGDAPLINVEPGSQGMRPWSYSSNLAITDLDFYCPKADPSNSAFTGKDNAHGIDAFTIGTDILIENIHARFAGFIFQGIANPAPDQTASNVAFRGDVVTDMYSTESHAQGLFANLIDGLLIEGCVFDHNGWNETVPGAEATMFNHNFYVNHNAHVVVRSNIISRASSIGFKTRSPALVEYNLFIDNPIVGGISNYTPDPAKPIHDETHILRGNWAVGSRSTNSGATGWGFDATAYSKGSQTQDGSQAWVVENNGLVHSGGLGQYFLQVLKSNYYDKTPINDVPLKMNNNIEYDWGDECLRQTDDFDGDHTSVRMMQTMGNLTGDTGDLPLCWKHAEFVDPTRDIASYNASIGGQASVAAFLAEVRKQRKGQVRYEYTSRAVNKYLREGFTPKQVSE